MIALGWVVNLFQRGAASMGRINRILAARAGGRRARRAGAGPAQVRGEVEFRDVSFRYPGTEREVLRDVSFRVPAGTMLAVVGRHRRRASRRWSRLLVRLFDPTAGQVLLDGVDVRRIPLERLRAAVGHRAAGGLPLLRHPPREPGAGPRGGAAGARRSADPRRRARRPARRHRRGVPRRLRHPAGRARREPLGRAEAARDARARHGPRPRSVLVLDDALSAVDTHTEAEILSGLRDVLRERTSVVVSHRVSAVMGADQIMVLDDGRIVERGTPRRAPPARRRLRRAAAPPAPGGRSRRRSASLPLPTGRSRLPVV